MRGGGPKGLSAVLHAGKQEARKEKEKMNAEMCLIPLTLCSGTIEGAEQWESCKALRRAMKTGRAQDVRAAGAAILQDMSDPKKAKEFLIDYKKEGLKTGIAEQEGGAILPNDEYLKPAERLMKSSQQLRMLGF